MVNFSLTYSHSPHTSCLPSYVGRITSLSFAKNAGWILSCARDKTFAAHCTETSNKIGGYTFEAWVSRDTKCA